MGMALRLGGCAQNSLQLRSFCQRFPYFCTVLEHLTGKRFAKHFDMKLFFLAIEPRHRFFLRRQGSLAVTVGKGLKCKRRLPGHLMLCIPSMFTARSQKSLAIRLFFT